LIFVLVGRLDHDDEGITVVRGAGNNLPKDTAVRIRARVSDCCTIEG